MAHDKRTAFDPIVLQWGIDPDIAYTQGWRLTNNGLMRVPTGDGYRMRLMWTDAYEGDSKLPKVFWQSHKKRLPPPMPVLYNAKALTSGVDHIYIVNGEKAVLSMMSAGINNVICTFGENVKIPEAIEGYLVPSGIKNYTLLPDYDDTGFNAAQKWVSLGQKHGLNITVLDLGGYAIQKLGLPKKEVEKWDIRDLWLKLNQQPDAFHKALENMHVLNEDKAFVQALQETGRELDEKRRRQEKNEARKEAIANGGQEVRPDPFYVQWKALVTELMDKVSPILRDDGTRRCPLSHHHDADPSFRITEMGVPNCSCKIQARPNPWGYLAADLGAPSYDDFKAAQIKKLKPKTPQQRAKEDPYRFANGVPDVLRTFLLRMHQSGNIQDQAAALIVLELWHRSKIPGNRKITIKDLTPYGELNEVVYKQLLKGFRQLIALGIVKRVGKAKPTNGRPAFRYQFQAIELYLLELKNCIYHSLIEYHYNNLPVAIQESWYDKQKLPDYISSLLTAYDNMARHEYYEEHKEEIIKVEEALSKDLEELERYFTLERLPTSYSSHFDPEAPLGNGSQYREAYYYRLAMDRIQNGVSISRTKAALQIGVTEKTMTSIRRRVNIYTIPQYSDKKLATDLRNVYSYIYSTIVPWMVKDGRQPYGPWLVFETPDGRRSKPLGVHNFADNPERLEEIYASQCKLSSQPYLQIQKASLEAVAEHEDLKEEIARQLDEQRTRSRKLAARKRAKGEYTGYDNRPECVPEGYTDLFKFNQLENYKPHIPLRNRDKDHQIIINAVPVIMETLDKIKDEDDISKIEEKLETLDLDPMIRKVISAVTNEWLEHIEANPEESGAYRTPLNNLKGVQTAIMNENPYVSNRVLLSKYKCSILANLFHDLPAYSLELYCTQGRFGTNHSPKSYLDQPETDDEALKDST